MQESVQKNSTLQSKSRLNSSLILPQLSTLNEKGLKPYWNMQCQELQSKLWLPHKIDSQGVDFSSSDGLSNYTEERLSYWIKKLSPKNLTQTDLIGDNKKQWYRDRMRYLNKKISRLKTIKNDLVENLHSELAYYLVSNYDIIFLPTFETKKDGRNIRIRTAREMLSLNHYKFKLKLKWYCQKYGKHLVDVDVDESYTSKTYSWNGFVDDKLKSKKVIRFQNMLIDRDMNGARGILIKQLSKVA